MEAIARKYLQQFHTSFTLTEHRHLVRDLERIAPKRALTELLDEVTVVAHTPTMKQEYLTMAKSVTAEKKPAAPAKEAKSKTNGSPVPRAPKHADTAKIKWLVKENPKRAGSASAERFDSYFNTKTVGEFLGAGGTRGDIANDVMKGYMEVSA